MGHVGSKTRSLGQISLKTCSSSRLHSFASVFMKLTRIFVLMILGSSLNKGYVGSKTRSLGPISSKYCSPSRGHSIASVFMKLHQNVCLDDILVKFECGSGWIKN